MNCLPSESEAVKGDHRGQSGGAPALGSLPLDLWVTAPCLTALLLVLHTTHLTSMALLCGLHLSSQEVGGVGQHR